MRTQQKKMAKEFVATLYEAHNEIYKEIAGKKIAELYDILESCQQGAISLGNFIEATEGEGTVTVSLLEDYCEMIYSLSEKLNDGIIIQNPKKTKNTLDIQLDKIKKSIDNDIPIKKEVVFLPYKAAMWDSLEAIWKEKKEDENVNVIVMPIPYYDKNPDGSFRTMHYEIDQYPDYVPVVDCRTYDLKENHPDEIYIHNPYDGGNYVTSVEPNYYASKICEYTECLIYVPYFVARDGNVGPHFCLTAGVMYSHKVLLPNEKERDTYKKEFIQFLYDSYLNTEDGKKMGFIPNDVKRELERMADEKFVIHESSKVLRVKNTKREDLYIPKEWQDKIKRSDGTDKTIVFYNVSIAALLASGYRMMIKIRAVLKFFEANQGDYVLLWRPHPLLQSTINSMLPALMPEYEKIVKEYRSGDWGIYDESPDITRAVVLCDKYYGDPSSVVELCKAVGKPILLQNPEVIDYRNLHTFEHCLIEGDEIRFVSDRYNAVFVASLNDAYLKHIGQIPEKKLTEASLCMKILKINEKYYYIPKFSTKIWVWDKDDNWEYVELENKVKDRRVLFFEAFQQEDKIIMIGGYYPAIVVVNTSTWKTEYITEPFERFNDSEIKDVYFRKNYVVKDSVLYLASALDNTVLMFNMLTYEYQWVRVGGENNTYSGIAWDGDFFWLAPRNATNIVKWDGKASYSEITLAPNLFQADKKNFIGCYVHNDRLVIPGLGTRLWIEVDVKSGEIKHIEKGRCISSYIDEMGRVITSYVDGRIEIDNKVYFFECSEQDKAEAWDCYHELIKTNKFYYWENSFLELSSFIEKM